MGMVTRARVEDPYDLLAKGCDQSVRAVLIPGSVRSPSGPDENMGEVLI